VRALGYLPDQDVADALAASSLSVTASAFESFSMTVMESWLADRAVLVNGAAAPLRAHVEASGGGLFFHYAPPFSAAPDRPLADSDLRARLAAAGHRYAAAHHGWDAVHAGWKRALECARARIPSPSRRGLG